MTWASAVLTAAQMNTFVRDNSLECPTAKVTTAGDLVYATGPNAIARLAIGANRKGLVVASGLPSWTGIPLLQRVKSTELTSTQTVTGTSFADVSGLSVSITTNGGRLKIFLLGTVAEAGSSSIFVIGGISSAGEAHIRPVVGSTNIGYQTIGSGTEAANTYVAPSSLQWEYTPAVNTYTVKIQARVAESGASLSLSGNGSGGVALVVEEYGD